MPDDRWRRIENLYHAALKLEPAERAAFLERGCEGDESIRREVASLLAQSDVEDSFLDLPAVEMAAKALAMSEGTETKVNFDRAAGTRDYRSHPAAIGHYRIVRLLGEGGMGAVYEAEQEQPRRSVALKVLKPGFCTEEALRRLEREAQALGRLQHPGIAQIYEAGTADTGFGQQPYFAMELIRGQSLMVYAEEHKLSTRQRLDLMTHICEAVHHAHQRGLIHRDLKPGNILVDPSGEPKILDFGVARMTGNEDDATRQTSTGQIIGTLSYMSPEQVLADPLELDTRSDVYSLGVILYELLSGRLPYVVSHRKLPEALRTIREDDPTSLSSLNRTYRGDIETIVGKALEKNKTLRYASAAELAADIRRYLDNVPIGARPPSTTYQLRKFAQRHRIAVGVASGLVLLLVAFAAVQAVQLRRIAAERDRANREAAIAQAVTDFLQNDLLAQAGASTQAGPNTKPDPHLEVRTALDRAASRIAGKFQKQPLVEAAIRHTIGITYTDLGLFGEAQKQEERALALRRQILGDGQPATWESMDRLAILYRLEGKYAQAEPLRKKLLEEQRRALGESDPDTFDAMTNLAVLYRYEGKPALAEPLYIQAIQGLRRLKGPENRQTVATVANLAQVYDDEAKYAEAERLYGQAIDAARRAVGEEHPTTLIIMGNLAHVYDEEGKFDQAEPLQRKVLEVNTRVLGAEHPDTLIDLGNLARLYRDQGRYAEADALFARVLKTQLRVVGEDSPVTLITMSLLGSVKWYEGSFAEAEQLLARALEALRRILGNDHPRTQSSLVWLGRARLAQRKFAQAEANFREAVTTYAKTSPAGWERYNSQSLLGESIAAGRRYEEAEPLLLSGYEGMVQRRDKTPASSRPDLDLAGQRIVRLYEDWHKPEKAAEWRRKLGQK